MPTSNRFSNPRNLTGKRVSVNFDIVIIGASMAGLYAGESLARAGKRVAIFERQKDLNPARRTLIVTHLLRKILGSLPDDMILHEIDAMAVATSNRETTIPLKEPDLIVERAGLIGWLASKFETAGGKLFLDHRFERFQQTSGGLDIVLQTSKGETIVASKEALIGADGAFSNVAKAAGISRPESLPIVQAEVPLPAGWDPSVVKVWFDTEKTRFFFWLIPESSSKGVVGLIGDHGLQTRESLKTFLADHDLKPEAYQASQVALYSPRLKPWTHIGSIRVYLVGDAAGQVKVSTVGGTVSGFLGAQAAASALLNGRSYRAHYWKVRRELNVHWLLRRLLDRLDNRGYDQLVGAVSLRVRNFLGQYDRDSMEPVIWRLPILEPRLLRVAWKCLRGKRGSRKLPDRQSRMYLPETD